MSGAASAYEALGLEPGADQDAVERAYKQLIKRYHPDRADGDAARAAEITQAYRELRLPVEQGLDRDTTFDLAEALYAQRAARQRARVPQSRRPRLWPFLILAILAAAILNRAALGDLARDGISRIERMGETSVRYDGAEASVSQWPSFDEPLNDQGIAAAVAKAVELSKRTDTQPVVEESRACHRSYRDGPSLQWLDRCSAFDDAVIEVENRDSVRDGGTFGPSAVTARQIAAARLLSSDYEAIEERLDRIRSRVRLLLAASEPAPLPLSLPKAAPGAASSLPPLVGSADGAAAH